MHLFTARSMKGSGIGRLLVTILEATELKAAKPNGEHECTKNKSSAFFFFSFFSLFYTFTLLFLFLPFFLDSPFSLFFDDLNQSSTCFLFTCSYILLMPVCCLSLLQVKVTLTVKWPWELSSSHPEQSTTPWTPNGTSTVSFTSKTSTRTSSASPSMKKTSFHQTVSYRLITLFHFINIAKVCSELFP